MPKKGIEPSPPAIGDQDLNLARLPIPPLRLNGDDYILRTRVEKGRKIDFSGVVISRA
jgi:hypothetical protein